MKHYEEPIVLHPKMTNTAGLPDPIMQVMEEDIYMYRRRVSVTGLQNPALKRELTLRYGDDIVTDADDSVARLLGSAVHNILEQAGRKSPDAIIERKVCTLFGDWQVSGKFDLLIGTTLYDFKTTGAFGWQIEGGAKPDDIGQINMYAELLRRNGYKVEKVVLVYLFRDWKRNEQKRSPQRYPAHPFMPVEVTLWPSESVCEYITGRIAEFEAAEVAKVPDIPVCTEHERWQRQSKFAAKKEGRKTAVKVFDTETEYRTWLAEQSDTSKLSLEVRPGVAVRCEGYCDVADFCPHGRSVKGLPPWNKQNYKGPYRREQAEEVVPDPACVVCKKPSDKGRIVRGHEWHCEPCADKAGQDANNELMNDMAERKRAAEANAEPDGAGKNVCARCGIHGDGLLDERIVGWHCPGCVTAIAMLDLTEQAANAAQIDAMKKATAQSLGSALGLDEAQSKAEAGEDSPEDWAPEAPVSNAAARRQEAIAPEKAAREDG